MFDRIRSLQTVRDLGMHPRTHGSDLRNPLCQEQLVWKVIPVSSLAEGGGAWVSRAHDRSGIFEDIARVAGSPTAMCVLGNNVIGVAGWQRVRLADQYRAVTEGAGAFVASNMHYLRVAGPDAAAVLDMLTPRDVGRLPRGRAMFTLFTTPAGTIDEEAIILRTGEDQYLVSCGGGKPPSWLAEAVKAFPRVEAGESDVVSFNLKGPRRMKAMQALVASTDRDRVGRLKPFDAVPVNTVDGEPGWVVRTTVGVEMWSSTEVIRRVWSRILELPDLITPCAWDLLNVYRVECTLMVFAVYPIDVHVGTTLWEVGYGWMMEKPPSAEFIGGDALRAARGRERLRLAGLKACDPSIDAPPLGIEVCTDTGAFAGHVTTAAFSVRHGCALAFAHLEPEHVPGTRLVIDGHGEWVVSTLPFDDP